LAITALNKRQNNMNKTIALKSIRSAIKISSADTDARRNLDLRSGDTVKVWQKIKEGDKTRLQVFEGLVLARKHGSEAGATFTVRRVASGVGVERVFPFYSPLIDKIEIVRRAKVRRAKLYHIRKKVAKEISREMRRSTMMGTDDSEKSVAGEEVAKGPSDTTASTENSAPAATENTKTSA
jgi:large subunit ribosomal protein L19